MDTTNRNVWLVSCAIIAVVIIIALVIAFMPNQAKQQAEVKALVTDFGGYLKSMSLFEPTEQLKGDIQQSYGPFITDELLQQWRSEPTHAPGRLTSSPWPDRIEITQVAPQGAGYVASGDVVMMTSAGEAGRIPVVAQVIKVNGKWKIAAYQEGRPIGPSSTTTEL